MQYKIYYKMIRYESVPIIHVISLNTNLRHYNLVLFLFIFFDFWWTTANTMGFLFFCILWERITGPLRKTLGSVDRIDRKESEIKYIRRA